MQKDLYPDAPDILIVDDDKVDRKLVRMAFEAAPDFVNLHFCESGMQAMDFLKRNDRFRDSPRPKACLLDINMPVMSGFDLLEKMKADDDLRTIPVIMFSSSDQEADIEHSYANHASGYVTKPDDHAELELVAATLAKLWTKVLSYA